MNLTLLFINNKVLTVPRGTIKIKIMYWKKIKKDICVEVLAMNEEGITVVIRKTVGDKGIHETYMDIYDKLMNMGEKTKWEVHCVRSRSVNSVYYNETKEEEV